MQPEHVLLHSQEPATCPSPQPDQSSPYPSFPLLKVSFKYYPPIYT